MIRVFNFVFRNPKTGKLYFRLSVPKRLRPLVGKSEIVRALKTTDKAVAIPRAIHLYCQIQNKFRNYESEAFPVAKKAKTSEKIPDNAFGYIEICTLMPDGTMQTMRIDTGDDDKDTEQAQKLSLPVQGMAAPSSVSFESAKLADVCRKYRIEMLRGGTWRQKTALEHEGFHDLLLQFFKNVEISTITRSDARKFKDVLVKLPPNHTKGTYAGKTIRQIIAMKPEKTLSVKSINDNYIQRYSGMFAWAVKQEYCVINPFEGLKMKLKGRRKDDREPFSTDDLKTIFNPKLFQKEFFREPWQYWLPILALYTGARSGELGQLRCVDVIEKDGVQCLNITEEAGHLKNEGSERLIPIHPEIIRLGFIDFVEEVRAGENIRLFPELFRVKIPPSDKIARWFNRTYMTKCGLRPSNRKISFHSFRHTFIQACKELKIPETLTGQITGHKHDSITYGLYGSDYNIQNVWCDRTD